MSNEQHATLYVQLTFQWHLIRRTQDHIKREPRQNNPTERPYRTESVSIELYKKFARSTEERQTRCSGRKTRGLVASTEEGAGRVKGKQAEEDDTFALYSIQLFPQETVAHTYVQLLMSSLYYKTHAN